MVTLRHRPDNRDGWRLDLKQVFDPDRLRPERRPVVMIPGYGMNAFILGYHPNGLSLEEYLVREGFEVWSLNLRGQGEAHRMSGSPNYGFQQLALVDLPCALDAVRTHTKAIPKAVDVIGCSLGASVMYAFLGHHPRDHGFGAIVSIGGPLRWDSAHPLMRVLFSSPRLAGAVPLHGTRKMARAALPIAKRIPGLLSFYMNSAIVDLSRADKLVQTVDNPNRRLNRQIAHWLRDRDLVVDGVNVTDALHKIDLPLMCILANKDGVVPPAAVLAAVNAIGSDDVEVLKVGDQRTWFAHADLFVSRYAQERVFEPLAQWLLARYADTPASPTQEAA